MPKMKTKKALKKRIKITGTGKWMRSNAFISHLAPSKTTKQKRQSRGWSSISNSDYKRLKDLI